VGVCRSVSRVDSDTIKSGNVKQMGKSALETIRPIDDDNVCADWNACLSGDFDVTLNVLQNVALW
jgi:hypothetical protein